MARDTGKTVAEAPPASVEHLPKIGDGSRGATAAPVNPQFAVLPRPTRDSRPEPGADTAATANEGESGQTATPDTARQVRWDATAEVSRAGANLPVNPFEDNRPLERVPVQGMQSALDGVPSGQAAAQDIVRTVDPVPLSLPQLRQGLSDQIRALAEQARTEISTNRMPDGRLTTELELAPAELGRLRLVLQTGERGLHLVVIVDRPESLDLVRRHLDGLHRGLIDDGVTLDSVDIGTGSRERGGGERLPHMPDPDAPVPGTPASGPESAPAIRVPATGQGRLDIRL